MDSRSERNAALRKAYDDDVARRGAMELDTWRIDTVEQWLQGIPDQARILELGAGTGQMASHVADLGYEVVAIDLSSANVAAMRDRGVSAHVADFLDLPFPDASFDAAFGINSLLHVPNDELPDVYGEIRRVLVPGASLLVVVWGGEDRAGPYDDDWLDPPRFFNFLSDDSLRTQPTPGFEKIEMYTLPIQSKNLHSQVLILEAR